MTRVFTYYLAGISMIAFCLAAYDKWAAKTGRWRIAEKTLLTVAAIGGAAGMYLSMQLFRHKTKHRRFMISLPVMIVLHLVLILKFIYHLW